MFKNGKIIIIIINVKMVQGSLENSLNLGGQNRLCRWIRLAKSSDQEKFGRILNQSEYSYNFMGDKLSVTLETRFLRKSRNSGTGLS